MKLTKNVLLLLSLVLLSLFSATSLKVQETPNETEDNNNTPVVDSIDLGEDLLDSNEAYRKQFESLSDDGEWEGVNKSEFLRDLSAETGEDFEIDYSQGAEIIYVWRPDCADQNWNPYTNGQWVFTYYGWMWVSSYDWGWGPYNYGRWYCSNYYGWVWLPGCVWAPNWVTWRCNNNYVGWYPCCPRVYWRNYQNNICTNYLYSYEPVNWVFVKRIDFTTKINNTTIMSSGSNAGIIKKSKKPETSIYATSGASKIKYKGPDVGDISKTSGKSISPKEVKITSNKGKLKYDEKNLSTYVQVSNPPLKEKKQKTNLDKPAGKNNNSKKNYSGTKQEYNNPPVDNGTGKVQTKKENPVKNTDVKKQPGNENNTIKKSEANNSGTKPKNTDPPVDNGTKKVNTKKENSTKSNIKKESIKQGSPKKKPHGDNTLTKPENNNFPAPVAMEKLPEKKNNVSEDIKKVSTKESNPEKKSEESIITNANNPNNTTNTNNSANSNDATDLNSATNTKNESDKSDQSKDSENSDNTKSSEDKNITGGKE